MAEARTYQLGVVGESNYQAAIRRCARGQCVSIVHEPDNPYDNHALVVVNDGGDTIGYVPRDCWLQDAIHEEGKGCDAMIRDIRAGEGGKLGVVLDVCLNTDGVGERAFSRTSAPERVPVRSAATTEIKGWLARLFGL